MRTMDAPLGKSIVTPVARSVVALFGLGTWVLVASSAVAVSISPGDILLTGSVLVETAEGTVSEGIVIKVDPYTGVQEVVSSNLELVTPVSIAANAYGDIFVLDLGNDFQPQGDERVVKIDPASGAQQLLATGGFIEDPHNLTLDQEGNVLVDTAFNPTAFTYSAVRIDPTDGTQTSILIPPPGPFASYSSPDQGIAVTNEGKILFLHLNGPTAGFGGVTAFDEQLGMLVVPDAMSEAFIQCGRCAWPVEFALAPNGDILIHHVLSGDGIDPTRYKLYDSSGAFLRSISPDSSPGQFAFDRDGSLVAYDGSLIRIEDITSGASSLVSSGGLFSSTTIYDLTVVPGPSIPEPAAILAFALGVGSLVAATQWPRERKQWW